MVKRLFFEISLFSNMKVCLQCAVSKTLLYGVVVCFETLKTLFSPGSYSTNNAYDIHNILEKVFFSDCQRYCNVKGFSFRQRFQTA